MGLRPTRGNEKRLPFSNHSPCKGRPFLCHPRANPDFLLHSSQRRHYVVLPKENHMQLIRSRSSRQEIRGSRGICSALFPVTTVLDSRDPPPGRADAFCDVS